MTTVETTDIATRTVADIMQHFVTTVSPEMPLSEVARVLWDHDVSGAPVVDNEGRALGVVSASDIVRVRGYGPRPHLDTSPPATDEATATLGLVDLCKPVHRPQPSGAEPTASEMMMPARFCVRPTSTIPELARFLVRAHTHRALVLDHDRLIGIVTTFDIVKEVARADEAANVEELPQQDEDIEC